MDKEAQSRVRGTLLNNEGKDVESTKHGHKKDGGVQREEAYQGFPGGREGKGKNREHREQKQTLARGTPDLEFLGVWMPAGKTNQRKTVGELGDPGKRTNLTFGENGNEKKKRESVSGRKVPLR